MSNVVRKTLSKMRVYFEELSIFVLMTTHLWQKLLKLKVRHYEANLNKDITLHSQKLLFSLCLQISFISGKCFKWNLQYQW
jgi:hypothetical protein